MQNRIYKHEQYSDKSKEILFKMFQ